MATLAITILFLLGFYGRVFLSSMLNYFYYYSASSFCDRESPLPDEGDSLDGMKLSKFDCEGESLVDWCLSITIVTTFLFILAGVISLVYPVPSP